VRLEPRAVRCAWGFPFPPPALRYARRAVPLSRMRERKRGLATRRGCGGVPAGRGRNSSPTPRATSSTKLADIQVSFRLGPSGRASDVVVRQGGYDRTGPRI